MKHLLLLTALLLPALWVSANDGVYYASGNHLIPIHETDISVEKEVLTITRMNKDEIQVVVDYWFHNPVDAKEITVGFEAPSPGGDVDGTPKDGRHPYIHDFSVLVNGEALDYQAAIVMHDTEYLQDGKIVSKTVEEVTGEDFNENSPDFYYVYHFPATFRHGENRVRHEYRFDLSGSVDSPYSFDYILTAANRWANKGINDFTLIIDMGEFQDFFIEKNFFTDNADWEINGRATNSPHPYEEEKQLMRVFSKGGSIVFKKKDFRPAGELNLFNFLDFEIVMSGEFDAGETELPYDISTSLYIKEAKDPASQKILRNLPFARRGYVFKTKEIQRYYESLDWYMPDPSYKATMKSLSKEEREWLAKVRGE